MRVPLLLSKNVVGINGRALAWLKFPQSRIFRVISSKILRTSNGEETFVVVIEGLRTCDGGCNGVIDQVILNILRDFTVI